MPSYMLTECTLAMSVFDGVRPSPPDSRALSHRHRNPVPQRPLAVPTSDLLWPGLVQRLWICLPWTGPVCVLLRGSFPPSPVVFRGPVERFVSSGPCVCAGGLDVTPQAPPCPFCCAQTPSPAGLCPASRAPCVGPACPVCHSREQPEQSEDSSVSPSFSGCVWAAFRSG